LRNTTIEVFFLALILLPAPGLAFVKIEKMPFSLRSMGGQTLWWNESYQITVGDLELQLVNGPGQLSSSSGVTTLNWDPEIVSIKNGDQEIMRRTGLGDFVRDDPLVTTPFLGLGGVVAPYNYARGLTPRGSPEATLTWLDKGDNGRVAWEVSYKYSPGDEIFWLNKTFVLNTSLQVSCHYELADGYPAIEQRVTIENGNAAQYLPFPLETSFSLGTKLQGKVISLPNMTLPPRRYLSYPKALPPSTWFNASRLSYVLPDSMWKEDELPGMLYVEFDTDSRDWFGMTAITELSYQMKAAVGVKIVSSEGFDPYRPYCVFVSGSGDHVIFGLKPYSAPGRYDDFEPRTLNPGEKVSVDLLWFFPRTSGDTMTVDDFNHFAESAPTISDFLNRAAEAKGLFEEAGNLAAQGDVKEALEKARASSKIYGELGKLSQAMLDQSATINKTIRGWESASNNPPLHPDRGSRSGILYSILFVIAIILALASWIYVLEPRRTRRQGE